MARPALEVADIFRGHGTAWRHANRGHVSLDQFKVMSAIENCRTAALGGHVARCEDCAHTTIAYNSCLMGKSSVNRRSKLTHLSVLHAGLGWVGCACGDTGGIGSKRDQLCSI
jgi:hypothetical protein